MILNLKNQTNRRKRQSPTRNREMKNKNPKLLQEAKSRKVCEGSAAIDAKRSPRARRIFLSASVTFTLSAHPGLLSGPSSGTSLHLASSLLFASEVAPFHRSTSTKHLAAARPNVLVLASARGRSCRFAWHFPNPHSWLQHPLSPSPHLGQSPNHPALQEPEQKEGRDQQEHRGRHRAHPVGRSNGR